MCSSSLTAVHEACEHLLRRECELAIAGGVNLYLHPTSYTGLCHQRMLSVDGRCKSFGMGGNGYVPGEGVGAVLLKPLARAIADGDRIHAVIRATSINHDGKTNGYTVPNPNAQGALGSPVGLGPRGPAFAVVEHGRADVQQDILGRSVADVVFVHPTPPHARPQHAVVGSNVRP